MELLGGAFCSGLYNGEKLSIRDSLQTGDETVGGECEMAARSPRAEDS